MKLFIAILASLLSFGCMEQDQAGQTGLAELLGGAGVDNYKRAVEPRDFSFPADHGAHDGFKNEWWYFTGHLADNAGREFGYQLTFFRISINPKKSSNQSRWSSNIVWMAHFAISDIKNRKHVQAQRYSREALDLAGVRQNPLEIWLEDWQIIGSDKDAFPWKISAQSDTISLDLTVDPLKPEVLQGEQGLSRKSSDPGNASYYYSITRLATSGNISISGSDYSVEGLSWLDREWSTSVLSPDQKGWDWFSLQLDDGRDVMFYQIRKHSGESDSHSSGKVIDENGGSRSLGRSDVVLEPQDYWTSKTGARYPVSWHMRIQGESGVWKISALFEDQEMRTAVNYWEGAVELSELQTGRILGKGYLEMTGY